MLDSHNPSPPCRLVPLPPHTRTRLRADVQAPVRTRGGLGSPSRPRPVPVASPPAAVAVLCVPARVCSLLPKEIGRWWREDGALPPSLSAQGEPPAPPETLIKGRRSAEAANRCYHCSRVLIDFNYTHIRFLVLLSRCRRLCRTVDNVYPLDLFYWGFLFGFGFVGWLVGFF